MTSNPHNLRDGELKSNWSKAVPDGIGYCWMKTRRCCRLVFVNGKRVAAPGREFWEKLPDDARFSAIIEPPKGARAWVYERKAANAKVI